VVTGEDKMKPLPSAGISFVGDLHGVSDFGMIEEAAVRTFLGVPFPPKAPAMPGRLAGEIKRPSRLSREYELFNRKMIILA
jgi:hypothetical protein